MVMAVVIIDDAGVPTPPSDLVVLSSRDALATSPPTHPAPPKHVSSIFSRGALLARLVNSRPQSRRLSSSNHSCPASLPRHGTSRTRRRLEFRNLLHTNPHLSTMTCRELRACDGRVHQPVTILTRNAVKTPAPAVPPPIALAISPSQSTATSDPFGFQVAQDRLRVTRARHKPAPASSTSASTSASAY